jgi:hypothetical protein
VQHRDSGSQENIFAGLESDNQLDSVPTPGTIRCGIQ